MNSDFFGGGEDQVFLFAKLVYTGFLCVLVPAYWRIYGPGNFLWSCDVALFETLLAFWLESPLLASMAAISILPEFAWLIDLLCRLLFGAGPIGLTEYMFKSEIPLWVRAISLFHIWFPFLLLWLVARLGYDGRAFVAQTLVVWVVVPLSYMLTKPSENVNWVHGFGEKPQSRLHPVAYLLLVMLLFPLVLYVPMHLILQYSGPFTGREN